MSISVFKEKPVAEVRDVSVQLNRDVVRLREEFGKALKSNYQAVIDTNERVHSLYGDIQSLDADLLQLCFSDEDSLPRIKDSEIPLLKIATRKGRRRSSVVRPNSSSSALETSIGDSSDFNMDELQKTLKVSLWVVAVTKFEQDPSTMNSLDELLAAFSDLPVTKTVLEYCNRFGEWIVAEKPRLSLDQYLSLLKLSERSEFQFEERIRGWLFEQIVEHPDILSGNVSPTVYQFTQTSGFREAMSNRLISQYEALFKKWIKCKDDKATKLKLLNPYDTEKKISALVNEITLYELGLADSKRVLLHECKENMLQLLTHLKVFTSETHHKELSDRLTQLLEEERSTISNSTKTDNQGDNGSNMNSLVDALLSERTNSHYIQYLSS
ncbi:unnamed protein product [Kluyveromyces dobzhanskii CBS 2104]|uniref:WGS project CCBQ000000000 data, contig 00028 n=1 Tax=Kluyveromyces dobzhanskii CBS 2104 TaxID=1427455 RepID=A0A0A8L0N0_9SACH|nr:unnamed protein product [Kluyveromyces dobzhanskii CBS 2104]